MTTPVLNKSQFNYGPLFDLLIVMAVLVIVKQSVLPFSMVFGGPASTLTAMIVATYLLHRREMSWKDLGLRLPDKNVKSCLKILGLTLVTFFAFALVGDFVGEIADKFFEDVGTSSRFDAVKGNFLAYLGIMFIVWTHSAFFEELLFRAFIINRGSAFLGGGIKADLVTVVFAALFFGYRHYYYQGMKGAIVTGSIGLVLGLLYLWYGRKNILPLVFAHGIMNSIGQTIRYLGVTLD